MTVEVTTVSRVPTLLSQTPAAVQVITAEDIRRSGASTLAEALRLAPNLQVAQVNAHDWAITARGFNGASVNTGSLANKLLVMIDGRSVYTPLFGGVFWDAQHVPLDDVERIEVVSGPGGTLWGANAVNGVINVITKHAQDTHGGRATLASGSTLEKFGALRYGGAAGADFHYRVHAQHIGMDGTTRGGGDGHDEWTLTQAGVRTDYRASDASTLTIQGDAYEGHAGDPENVYINGQNVLARWTRASSPRAEWTAQLYFDRTVRAFPTSGFNEQLETADFDFQHRIATGARNVIVWGGGYRHMRDDVRDGASFSFPPAQRTMRLTSAFVQDELTLPGNALKLSFGAKLEHNSFSGLETQPSVRVAWTPPGNQMAWAAVSRAVRSPARFDTDLRTRTTAGNPEFAAEKVVAYEAGYRIGSRESFSVSLAAFHNRYRDIRSINANPAAPPALIFDNDLEATSSGAELSGAYQPAKWWYLRGGYTYLEKSFDIVDPRVVSISDAFEAQDPSHQMLIQSLMDLPRDFELDVVARYVHEIPATAISPTIRSYATADVRLGWRVSSWQLAVIGRNLGGSHPEFASPVVSYEIPRAVEGRVSFAW